MESIYQIPKKILLRLIYLYQMMIRPYKKPCCRFTPTCSQYAMQAIKTYGACKGLLLIMIRLLKCQPFHAGGLDPVKREENYYEH